MPAITSAFSCNEIGNDLAQPFLPDPAEVISCDKVIFKALTPITYASALPIPAVIGTIQHAQMLPIECHTAASYREIRFHRHYPAFDREPSFFLVCKSQLARVPCVLQFADR